MSQVSKFAGVFAKTIINSQQVPILEVVVTIPIDQFFYSLISSLEQSFESAPHILINLLETKYWNECSGGWLVKIAEKSDLVLLRGKKVAIVIEMLGLKAFLKTADSYQTALESFDEEKSFN